MDIIFDDSMNIIYAEDTIKIINKVTKILKITNMNEVKVLYNSLYYKNNPTHNLVEYNTGLGTCIVTDNLNFIGLDKTKIINYEKIGNSIEVTMDFGSRYEKDIDTIHIELTTSNISEHVFGNIVLYTTNKGGKNEAIRRT